MDYNLAKRMVFFIIQRRKQQRPLGGFNSQIKFLVVFLFLIAIKSSDSLSSKERQQNEDDFSNINDENQFVPLPDITNQESRDTIPIKGKVIRQAMLDVVSGISRADYEKVTLETKSQQQHEQLNDHNLPEERIIHSKESIATQNAGNSPEKSLDHLIFDNDGFDDSIDNLAVAQNLNEEDLTIHTNDNDQNIEGTLDTHTQQNDQINDYDFRDEQKTPKQYDQADAHNLREELKKASEDSIISSQNVQSPDEAGDTLVDVDVAIVPSIEDSYADIIPGIQDESIIPKQGINEMNQRGDNEYIKDSVDEYVDDFIAVKADDVDSSKGLNGAQNSDSDNSMMNEKDQSIEATMETKPQKHEHVPDHKVYEDEQITSNVNTIPTHNAVPHDKYVDTLMNAKATTVDSTRSVDVTQNPDLGESTINNQDSHEKNHRKEYEGTESESKILQENFRSERVTENDNREATQTVESIVMDVTPIIEISSQTSNPNVIEEKTHIDVDSTENIRLKTNPTLENEDATHTIVDVNDKNDATTFSDKEILRKRIAETDIILSHEKIYEIIDEYIKEKATTLITQQVIENERVNPMRVKNDDEVDAKASLKNKDNEFLYNNRPDRNVGVDQSIENDRYIKSSDENQCRCDSTNGADDDSQKQSLQRHDLWTNNYYDDDRNLLDLCYEIGKEYITQRLIKPTDRSCDWDWKSLRCEPVLYCSFQYEFGDYHLGRSCRRRYPRLDGSHKNVTRISSISYNPSVRIPSDPLDRRTYKRKNRRRPEASQEVSVQKRVISLASRTTDIVIKETKRIAKQAVNVTMTMTHQLKDQYLDMREKTCQNLWSIIDVLYDEEEKMLDDGVDDDYESSYCFSADLVPIPSLQERILCGSIPAFPACEDDNDIGKFIYDEKKRNHKMDKSHHQYKRSSMNSIKSESYSSILLQRIVEQQHAEGYDG